jgi:hypothetical protein
MSDELKIILEFARDTLGASIHDGAIDFGCGCFLEVSIEDGKIKLDGGMSSGIEYFQTTEQAIQSLSLN